MIHAYISSSEGKNFKRKSGSSWALLDRKRVRLDYESKQTLTCSGGLEIKRLGLQRLWSSKGSNTSRAQLDICRWVWLETVFGVAAKWPTIPYSSLIFLYHQIFIPLKISPIKWLSTVQPSSTCTLTVPIVIMDQLLCLAPLCDFHMNKLSDPNMKSGLNTGNLQVYTRAYL